MDGGGTVKLQQLLGSLQKVRRTAKDQWVACCPAHADKNPSMTVKAASDTILIHCFAGCSIQEILGAVGMDVSDLYPDHDRHTKPQHLSARAALECVSFEALVVLATAGTMKSRPITSEEMSRLATAAGRIHAAMRMSGVAT